MESLKKLVKSYETWVAANPETVSDVETTSKWISYFIAGRVSDSTVLSELIYSLSNILVLYNDRIIERQSITKALEGRNTESSTGICYRLKVMLTTLEYCEVFIEISAKRIFGVRGKWIFVVLLQSVKAAGRYFILQNAMENIITSPAMPCLNRRLFVKQLKSGDGIPELRGGVTNEPVAASASFTFQLKRSGRVVRKVEGAPPLQYRDFKLQQELNNTCNNKRKRAIPLALLQAEYLYIAKPLLHLATMGVFGGGRRWQQFVVALSIDLVSIRFYYKHRNLMTKQQKLEMSRRCVNLLLYLMRSPFYERYTETRLERFLVMLTRNIPLVKMVANPLLEYIPHWQKTYFYLWST